MRDASDVDDIGGHVEDPDLSARGPHLDIAGEAGPPQLIEHPLSSCGRQDAELGGCLPEDLRA